MSFTEEVKDSDLVALLEMQAELEASVEAKDCVWTQADVDKVATYIENYQKQQGRVDAGRYFVERQKEFLQRYFPRLGTEEEHAELKAYFCSRFNQTLTTWEQLKAAQDDDFKRWAKSMRK